MQEKPIPFPPEPHGLWGMGHSLLESPQGTLHELSHCPAPAWPTTHHQQKDITPSTLPKLHQHQSHIICGFPLKVGLGITERGVPHSNVCAWGFLWLSCLRGREVERFSSLQLSHRCEG